LHEGFKLSLKLRKNWRYMVKCGRSCDWWEFWNREIRGCNRNKTSGCNLVWD